MKKTNSRNQLFALSFLVGLLSVASGCGVIPHAYQGKYVDDGNGVKLELKTSEGMLQLASGRTLQTKAENLSFDKLQQGIAGIYVILNPASKDILEIHWISPRAETRREEGGLIWFESEVLYSFLDLNSRDTVDSLALVHCENGTVLLDPPTKRWQIGCPAGALTYQLRRAQNSLNAGSSNTDESFNRNRR